MRLQQFLFRRSLWLDEMSLSLNIVTRGFAGLTRPLALNQGAPIGFLMLQRASVSLFGTSEYALRLVPLIAGLAALPLFYLLARRLLSAWAAAVAMALFSICGPVIYYSAEAKQYSLDVLVALLVLLASVRLLDEPITLRRALQWAAVGAAVVWFSHPAAFMLGGASAVLVLTQVVRREWIQLRHLLTGCALWLGSFGLEYTVSLRRIAENPLLTRFWRFTFPPDPLTGEGAWTWFGDLTEGLVAEVAGLGHPALGLQLAGVGLLLLMVRRRPAGALLVGPLIVAIAACAMSRYPISGRLGLFLVPTVLLSLVGVLDLFARHGLQPLRSPYAWRRWLRTVPALVLVLPVALTANRAFADFRTVARAPTTRNEARPVLEEVGRQWRTGDLLLVHETASTALKFYGPGLGLRAEAMFLLRHGRTDCTEAENLERVARASRIWLFFAHPAAKDPIQDRARYIGRFGAIGRATQIIERPGSSAVLLTDLHAVTPLGTPQDCLRFSPYERPAHY